MSLLLHWWVGANAVPAGAFVSLPSIRLYRICQTCLCAFSFCLCTEGSLQEGSSQDVLEVGMSSVCLSLFQWLWSTWPTLCLYLFCVWWNKGLGCCEYGVQMFPGRFLQYWAPLASSCLYLPSRVRQRRYFSCPVT